MKYILTSILTLVGVAAILFIIWRLRLRRIRKNIEELDALLLHQPIPCRLFTMVAFNQEQDAIITDFSRYEEEGIIGYTALFTHPPDNEEEEMIDGMPQYFDLAAVWQIADGIYKWEVW